MANGCITFEMYLYCVSVSVWGFSVLYMRVGRVGCCFIHSFMVCVGPVICAGCEATSTLQGAFDFLLPCSPSYTVSVSCTEWSSLKIYSNHHCRE